MNKGIIAGVVIAGLVLLTGGFLLLSDDPATVEPVTSTASDGTVVENSKENYVDFSEETLLATADTKRIVFFHADWCSTCTFFEKQIKEQGVPENVTILKANYDRELELKSRYGVTVQSTFVLLDENGEVERTWPFASGLRSIQDLYTAVI